MNMFKFNVSNVLISETRKELFETFIFCEYNTNLILKYFKF